MITYLPLIAILLGFFISAPLVGWLVSAGRRARMLDSEGTGGHEKELRSIPNIGGVGIFWGAVGPIAVGLALLMILGVENLLPSVFAQYKERIHDEMGTWIAIVSVALILHVVGIVDDRRALGAWLKLVLQLLLAAMVVILFDVRLLHVLDDLGSLGWVASVVLTILWLVIITNALNFLDNMDGLAAGVGAIAATILMIATMLNGQWFIAISLGMLSGALIGFLIFNFPPAKIFMGDGGSLVIGWLLAVATVRTTFVDTADPDYALGSAWYGVFMPIVVLAVPLYDFTSVCIIRVVQGRSPFVGDQQHFSHRLVGRGLSKRRTVISIWALAVGTGVSGILLGSVRPGFAILLGMQTLFLLGVLAILESGMRRSSS
jgi:UDP-GlcNAc:undecaprenyl-phosphate GlcNAc-1-phosphate transferase